MSNPKIIDISKFEIANKEEMDSFNEALTNVIRAIAEVSIRVNPNSKLSLDKVTDRKNWDMKDFTPKSGRSAPKMEIKSENSNLETGSILTDLKHRLDDCKTNNKEEKKAIQLLKGRLVFLGIQSASKFAEVAALDHIDKIEKNLVQNTNPICTDDIALLYQISNNLQTLSRFIKEYSIDTLTDNSPRGHYSSEDIGKHNTKVLKLYNQTGKLIDALLEKNLISENIADEYIDDLNDSRMCFQHKSNINFDFPTKDPTKKTMRNLTTLGLGLVSLASAVGATACTVVSLSGVTAPATAPAALSLTLISASSGGAAFSITALNSAINYWAYDISPSKNEKIGMALGVTSLALTGISFIPAISNLSGAANVIAEIGSQAYTTGSNIYGVKEIVDTVVTDPSEKRNFKRNVTFNMREELQNIRQSEENLHSNSSLSI